MLKQVEEQLRIIKPDHVWQIGDLYDMLSFGKYPKSANHYTPQDELLHGRACAVAMWKNIQRAAPKAKCHQILGNHDARIMKRVLDKAPELESLIGSAVRDLFEFENVQLHTSETVELDNICFTHGCLQFGAHAQFTEMNTVCGHLHRGQVIYFPKYWELNVGFLGQKHSPNMSYVTLARFAKMTHGLGVVDQNGPRFVPF